MGFVWLWVELRVQMLMEEAVGGTLRAAVSVRGCTVFMKAAAGMRDAALTFRNASVTSPAPPSGACSGGGGCADRGGRLHVSWSAPCSRGWRGDGVMRVLQCRHSS